MIQKTYYKTKDYCKVKFSIENEEANSVEILGLNNDWKDSIVLKRKKDGTFSTEVNLPRDSRHEFKYLIDESKWANEPAADAEVPNPFGGSNSVITL
jgi:1,4-alpha-glucan branching enzyme